MQFLEEQHGLESEKARSLLGLDRDSTPTRTPKRGSVLNPKLPPLCAPASASTSTPKRRGSIFGLGLADR